MRRIAFEVSAGTLYARVAGPDDGPAVILLHGFPDFSYGWRKQIPALAAAGWLVVALDQRGYNESAKPKNVRDYAVSELTADVIAVADALGRERVALVGHDWGGIVAWAVGMQHPHRVHRMVILNAPHPAVARRFLMTSPRQMLRSWYMLFFQLPKVPEKLFSAAGFEAGVRSLTATSAPGTFSAEELDTYRAAWSQPGALTAMINWYRALARHARRSEVEPIEVQAPTRIVWGAQDQFLLRELATASARYCRSGDLVELENATHWLHLEQPERVNATVLDWLDRSGNS
ncbi:MAG TPA: alpha/beta hydrolase [Bryobacteraceae bacterium]|nr:alpha/beta hydrolase [Bryobacteraceae bacterium]